MLTMPQWFEFLGIQKDEIEERLEEDEGKYTEFYYFLGIILALLSSFLDVLTMFVIRKLGEKVPPSLFAFISGICSSSCFLLYIIFFDPFEMSYFTKDLSSDQDALDTREDYK